MPRRFGCSHNLLAHSQPQRHVPPAKVSLALGPSHKKHLLNLSDRDPSTEEIDTEIQTNRLVMSDPDEAKELRLVNNVELKIALADGDDKLQRLLNLYLPPLLLKLASPHVSVRNKVISVCQHVNTRIKPPTLLLPVAALLAQFKDPQIGGRYPLVRNFDLMYVQIGIERLPVSERLALLPPLLKDISKHNNATHQRALFNILLKLLPYFEPPLRGTNEDTALRVTLGFEEAPEDAAYIAFWFAKLMLLNLSVFVPQSQPQQPGQQALPALPAQKLSCPGLSPEDFEFLTLGGKKETFTPFSVLADIKKSALKFLASGAFTDRERFFPTLIAASDSNSAVSSPAEDIFRRSLASVSLEDATIIAELYALYFGSTTTGTPAVKVVLQTRIVTFLAKSQTAVGENWKTEIVRIIEVGLETDHARLRQAAFSFVNWASRMGGEEVMAAVAGDVVDKVRYWILSTGSEDGGSNNGGDELRGYAYESLGLLAKRAPGIVIEPEWKLLNFLFSRLRDEPAGIVGVSVEGALSTLLPVIAKARMNRDVEEGLEELIVEQMVAQKGRSTRFSAVRYANRTLDFGNVVGRWANLLAVGRKGERGEVVEEAKKGLHPYYYRLLNPEEKYPVYSPQTTDAMDIDPHPPAEKHDKFTFPSFADVTDYFFNGVQHHATTWGPGDKLVSGMMPLEVFATALAFVRRVAFMEALDGEEVLVDEDWERKLDIAVERDDKIRTKLRAYFKRLAEDHPRLLERFMGVAWEGMVYEGIGVEGVRDVWAELVGVVPGAMLEGFVERVGELRKCVQIGMKLEGRATTARAMGLVGSHEAVSPEVLQTLLKEIEASAGGWEKAGGQELNRVHGGILAVGYLLARLKLRGRLEVLEKEVVDKGVGVVVQALLNARDQMVLDAAITAFSEICIFGVVGREYFDNSEKILGRLVTLGKKGKEKAIHAMGYFALVFPEDEGDKGEVVQNILGKLISMHENRQIELNFATGEALAAVAGGWQSKGVKGKIDLGGFENLIEKAKDEGRLRRVVEKVLGFVKETKPSLRKATCVWMLSLLEFLGDSAEVQSKLSEMQRGFRGFLVDRDDLVQETAARGLTMVYELGDKETKDDLVKSLVSSFTGEKRTLTGNVSADTELFEPGALPTGDGSISTYKDIMSLAAEVGDPSLVYKFMSLARHNSLWSSRAAFGRFGLGSILSSSDVLKHNPKLYPKLYRYRFDPNPNVAKSMEDIWKSLIGGEEREVLEVWFETILEDLLEQALGREWRTRESCCKAIGELVQGRGVEKYGKYLERIWSVAFKVLDDVKESVRAAAMKLCRVLTTAMIKNVDVNAGSSPKDAETVLKSLMPFLMGGSGLDAGAKEVQIFALRTLLQLVKTGGKAILLYVPSLVDKFVTLLSSLEPEVVNYLHLNADKYNTTGEDIDRMRLSNVRGSPMMDAIERCLDLLDGETMKSFIPQLQKTIRKALGLPSKIGCSRIIVTLVVRHGFVTKPYANDLLKTIQSSLKDRNETVMVSYANAAGYLCRIASDEKILGLVLHARKLYFEGEDEKSRALAGEIAYAICKHATDRFNALSVDVLPFLFVGKHDPEGSVNETFGKAWSENTGGTGAIKLSLVEIVDMTKTHLASQRWAIKQTAALSLADACKSIGTDLSAEQLHILWPVLVSATSGKSWDGKEAVLDALVSLAVDGKAHFGSDAGKLQELKKIVLREAKRNNPSYRSSSLKSLGSFVSGFDELDLFAETYEIVTSSVSHDNEDTMDVDAPDGRSVKLIRQLTLMNGLSALSHAFQPKLHNTGATTKKEVLQILDLLEEHMAGANYEVKTCGAECLERIIDRLSSPTLDLGDNDWDSLLERIWPRVLENSRDRGHENVRLKGASAIVGFLKLQGHGNIWGTIRDDLRQTLAEERSSVVLQVMESAVTRFLLR